MKVSSLSATIFYYILSLFIVVVIIYMTSMKFTLVLSALIYFYYRNHILGLNNVNPTNTPNRKRAKPIVFIFLLIWGILSALLVFKHELSPNLNWYKLVLIGFAFSVTIVTIPVFIAENSYIKEKNKKFISRNWEYRYQNRQPNYLAQHNSRD